MSDKKSPLSKSDKKALKDRINRADSFSSQRRERLKKNLRDWLIPDNITSTNPQTLYAHKWGKLTGNGLPEDLFKELTSELFSEYDDTTLSDYVEANRNRIRQKLPDWLHFSRTRLKNKFNVTDSETLVIVDYLHLPEPANHFAHLEGRSDPQFVVEEIKREEGWQNTLQTHEQVEAPIHFKTVHEPDHLKILNSNGLKLGEIPLPDLTSEQGVVRTDNFRLTEERPH